MKNYILSGIAFLTALVLFQSCRGPEGPEGIPGKDGNPGPEAAVMEAKVTFNAAGKFAATVQYPQGFNVLESDAIIVYRLVEEVPIQGEAPAAVWQPLPQVIMTDQGMFQYNFDHTFFDLNLFLEATFNLGTLRPEWTENQIFRIVAIPGYIVNARTAAVDFKNYNEVAKAYGIDESKVIKLY